MLKISYQELRSDALRSALGKLVNCRKLDTKTAYRIMRTAKEIEKQLIKSQTEWLQLASNLVEIGENQQFQTDENGFVFKKGVDPEDAKKKIELFGATAVDIDRWRLPLEKLEGAELTPAEIGVLEFLIDVSHETSL